MPLTLSLGVDETVFIGDEALTIRSIYSFAVVTVIGLGRVVQLHPERRTEIAPGISLTAKTIRPMRQCRITFEAPPNVLILREHLRDKDNPL